jgi:hypothetical protein
MAGPDDDAAALAKRVVAFGVTHVGHKVGRGECWDLPNDALKAAGGSTPNDLGKDLYVWGQPIADLADAQPGDILQFENVKIHRTWVTGDRVKHTEDLDFMEKHSAIVEKVDKGMWFTTLNAHVNGSKRVQRLRMNLSSENIVKGKIYVFRPMAKRK